MGNATAMPGTGSLCRRNFAEPGTVWAGIVAVSIASCHLVPRCSRNDSDGKKPDAKAVAQGRSLFEREWQPGDSRTHGGDGLGPVFNDSSCVACHNQGGTGGAGSSGKNVDIITATPNGQNSVQQMVESNEPQGFLAKRSDRWWVRHDRAGPGNRQGRRYSEGGQAARPKVDTTELVKAHPGFRTAQRRRCTVRHRRKVRAMATKFRRVAGRESNAVNRD